MTDAESRDTNALYWARALGTGSALFKDVPVGGRFQFARRADAPVYVRTKSGYRDVNGGRVYRTGTRTGVFPLFPNPNAS